MTNDNPSRHMPEFTPAERWKPSRQHDAVILDVDLTEKPPPGSALEYYGGHVVAESIPGEDRRRLIAAAPELLEAAEMGETAILCAIPHAGRILDILLPLLEKIRAAITKTQVQPELSTDQHQ